MGSIMEEQNATRLVYDEGDIEDAREKIAREPYQLAKGAVLEGRYVIDEILGFGGFGIIYSAWDKTLDISVAIKEYYPASIVNRNPGEMQVRVLSEKKRAEFEKGITRFLGEAQSTIQFAENKNIVRVYNYFQENGTAYLVMEYLNGVTLKQYTEKMPDKKLSYEEVLRITQGVIAALKDLHKKGIIHRDISPDNIIMCKDGTVKLIDFGAARFTVETEEERTRSIILKPGFSPAEQYQSKGKQGPWTDIYALGATMYRAITGVLPEESTDRVVNDELKESIYYAPQMPQYLNNILMKCMAVQPELRFQTVESLEAALYRKRKVTSTKKELFRRKLARAVLIAVIAVGFLLLGINEYRYIQAIKNKANLEKTEVTIWVPISNDVMKQETQKAAFEEQLTDFRKTYPMVDLSITYLEEDVYAEELNAAIHEDTGPVLFESSYLTQDKQEELSDLGEAIKLIKPEQYQFGSLSTSFANGKQIATGFDVPILFENTNLEENVAETDQNNKEFFLQGKAPSYVGTMEDYEEIQDALAGIYSVSLADSGQIQFTNIWGVSKHKQEAQRNAACRVIYYMLSEQAQDVWYVQEKEGIPLESNVLQTYLDINPELAFIHNVSEEQIEVVEFDDTKLEEIYEKNINMK